MNAEQDIEVLTGVKIPHSTQHRLIANYHLSEPKIKAKVKSLSMRKPKACQSSKTTICAYALRGTVRLRTPSGQKSEWKNYKAAKIHEQEGVAFFQNNQSLVNWVNQQPLSRNVNCLGDGHDGVWNIVEQIGIKHQRREILDWYHRDGESS